MKLTTKKALLFLIPVLLLSAGFGYWQYTQQQAKERASIARQAELKAQAERDAREAAMQEPKQPVTPELPPFNKQQLSVDDPASIWVVVNKRRSLTPADYVPGDLVTPNVPLRSAG